MHGRGTEVIALCCRIGLGTWHFLRQEALPVAVAGTQLLGVGIGAATMNRTIDVCLVFAEAGVRT